MLEATSNMATGSKSLSDFDGLPWSSWAEYLESTNSPDEEEEKWKVPSGVMRLYSSDMEKFGLFPETDMFCTVVCNECGAVVKPQGLLNHMRVKHKDLVLEKSLSIEKFNKLSVNDNSIRSAKYALNEKLMSKFLADKIVNKSSSSDKLSNKPASPSEKHSSKSSSDKYSSEKISVKSSEKLSSRTVEKIKSEKQKLFSDDKNDLEKQLSKSLNDVYSKTNDLSSYKPNEKMAKLSANDKIGKAVVSEKYSSKFSDGRKSPSHEKLLSRSNSSEKLSVKSVLSEKLLSKVAAHEKLEARVVLKPLEKEIMVEKSKSGDGVKQERSSLKSLLKEKIAQCSPSAPGSSLLRPVTTPTTLAPPVLTRQNRTPERERERQPSSADMPVLSRKRRYRERKSTAPAQLDLDRHCGVWCDFLNKYCVRSLTCKVHSVSLRRAVAGRSKSFDTLLLEHRRAKESSRLPQDDQEESLESLSERVATPGGGSTNSSAPPSPGGSPGASPGASPSWSRSRSRSRSASPSSTSPSPKCSALDEGATSLMTPCVHTSPPTPMASYQYPPFPPPLSTSPAPAPALSQYLSTPLLNVALPGLGANHSPRPPDAQVGAVRLAAKERGHARNRQLNVKHAAYPPKPLRACLFQGRKSSGMFVMQRQLEAVRTGFSISMVRSNKVALSCKSPPPPTAPPLDAMTASLAPPQSTVIPTEPARNPTAGAAVKSLLGTLCATKTVIQNERMSRPHKVTILPATAATQQGVLRVPVNLKAVLPKPSASNPIRYTIATRDNGQFHVPNILTASRAKGDERGQARVKPEHVISTLVPQLGAPVTVAIANGPGSAPGAGAAAGAGAVAGAVAGAEQNAAVASDKLQQGLRVTVPSNVSQQITYLTAAPVTFQQIPVLSPQVLGQLQPKGAGGGLKPAAGSSPRTVVVQEQDTSATES